MALHLTKTGESTIINHNRQIMSRNLYPKRNSYIKERGTIIMTKIKNTKKGMAKKTLSMSLVVAMLATSNVPVWAAEFSDGTDAAFTSEAEAPAVETTDAASAADDADTTETTASDYYTSTVKAEQVKVGEALKYSGDIVAKDGATVSVKSVKWYYKKDATAAATEVTPKSETNLCYATEKGFYYAEFSVEVKAGETTYTDTVKTETVNINVTIDLSESITGTVSIANEASNQWGYISTASYSAALPENISLTYTWQVYNEETKNWEDAAGSVVKDDKNAVASGKFIPDKADCGKKLRVLATFKEVASGQVIKSVESNSYEVAPLQITGDDEHIKIEAPENFGLDKSDESKAPTVTSVKVKNDSTDNKVLHNESEALIYGEDYTVVTQNTDRPGVRTVTIKLIGAYSGEITKTVNLNEFDISTCKYTLESSSVEFAGDGQYVAPVVKEVRWANRYSLKENEDYVIDKSVLKNCINAHDYEVAMVKGQGDFTGKSLNIKFSIVSRSMEHCKVVWTGKPVVKGEPLVAGVDVKDSENTDFVVVDEKGYVLVPDKDYTYDKSGIYDVSGQKCKVKVTATGAKGTTNGNYYGTAESDYITVGTNLEANLTKYVAATVTAQNYTGQAITFGGPKSAQRLDKISAVDVAKAAAVDVSKVGFKDDLEVGVDFDIVYKNNVNAYLLKDADGKMMDGTGVDAENLGHYYQDKTSPFKGVDFDEKNDDPQAPQVYLVFKGKYSGQTTPVRFAINQLNINDAETLGTVTFDPTATDANAMSVYADQVKALRFKDKPGNVLKDTVDYTYDYYYVNDTTDVSTEKGQFNLEVSAHTSKVMDGKERITVYDGNYYGTKKVEAKITAKSLKSESIKVAAVANQKYNGKLIEPKVTVTDGSYTLVEGTDYKLSYKNNRSAGTATIYINGVTAKNRYKDTITTTFTIENKSIADSKIMKKGSWNAAYTDLSKYKASDYVLTSGLYNGDREVTTEFDVVDANNNLLREGYDYTVAYKNNTKVGTATIVITGKGDYEGTLEGSFTIVGKGISGHFVEEKIPAQTYTGEAIQPKVTFKPDTPNLVEGRDYEITYEYNVNPGKGDEKDINNVGPKVVARGIGQYAGYVKLGFEIKKADISVADVKAEDATYAGGKVAKSKITVTNPASGKALKEGEDYTVEYVSGQNVGETGKAVLHLVNNKCYTFGKDASDNASITVTYKIVAKDLKDVTVEEVKDQTATGIQIKPTLTVLNDGVLLKEGVDYQVVYGENTAVGTGTATIKPVDGNKNYTGSKEVTFNIVEAKPEVGKAVISEVRVSGNTVTPVLSSEVEGAVGYDYVISTVENTKDGRVDISKDVLKTNTDFYYVEPGTYYAYCHAWKRGADGKKVFGAWSNVEKFEVKATTPSTPTITSVKAKGNTVTVTYTASEDATGYDVVLGSSVKKVNGEKRPVDYGTLVQKNVSGKTVTVTFKGVPSGKYYAGLHAYNKTSENGKKVFSKWSNSKAVTVK